MRRDERDIALYARRIAEQLKHIGSLDGQLLTLGLLDITAAIALIAIASGEAARIAHAILIGIGIYAIAFVNSKSSHESPDLVSFQLRRTSDRAALLSDTLTRQVEDYRLNDATREMLLRTVRWVTISSVATLLVDTSLLVIH
ncbi:MAG TPA: hypothetical protein VIJ12_06295 [Candidatus Baltobacteraceae bacterium]